MKPSVIGIGYTAPNQVELVEDTRRGQRCAIDHEGLYLPKIVARLDGQGAGSGDQVLRGTVHLPSGTLIAQGEEVVVHDGDELAWVDLPFADPVALPGEDVVVSVHAGGNSNSARLSFVSSGPPASDRYFVNDAYADGASASAGAPYAGVHSIYAPIVSYWDPPEGEESAWYARLPWREAQRVLGSTGPTGRAHVVGCGWHGVAQDEEEGAFAIVQTGSEIADLVGDRLAIRYGKKVVYVYCHREDDVLEEISLTRRAFLGLATLAEFELGVEVEVLS